MDLGSIAEAKLAHDLETLYLGLYHQKYGCSAHVEQQDRNTFQWLATRFPKPKAVQIIEAYFQVSDPFITKKCHPVKMIRSEINQIIPQVKTTNPKSKLPPMLIPLACDLCGAAFQYCNTQKQLDNPKQDRHCPECVKNPLTLPQVEAKIASLPHEVGNKINTLMRLIAVDRDVASREFGKFCAAMISKKESGFAPKDLSWKDYSDVIGYVAWMFTR